ncbi:MAG TPA: threonine synthase [Candidatus Acidoferrum sp.]|nr:threonine synthase [Candidatus Acidoferrum sp.]
MKENYFLRCRECGKKYPNQPQSYCEECFSPLEVSYDYDTLRHSVTREAVSHRAFNMWRYAEFLPLPQGYASSQPIGGTPLVKSRKLSERLGVNHLYFKNDAVDYPTLSFKDRVVATALAAARRFGFKTIGCSSTGNLANAVAAQGAQHGFDTCVFIPADLEPAKILNTAVYGSRVIRINGNYDHVNRLCTQIADKFRWGLVNVNLRPYYAEGSKTHGYEIAEQLGWELPDNVVVPMAGGSLIGKIAKAFCELAHLGWVEPKRVKFFGAQATGCSPIADGVKRNLSRFEPQKPNTIARSLAIGNPADGPFALRLIRESGGWAEDISDPEIIDSIRLLAECEGIFAETAGGVTTGVAAKLIEQGRISRDETTVVSITGNGLKTTDAIAADFPASEAIAPRLDAFEALLHDQLKDAVQA